MNTLPDWTEPGREVLIGMASKIWGQMPGLLAAVALLFLGWLVARLLRSVAIRALRAVETLIQRVYHHRGLDVPANALASTRVLGEIMFWVVMLFFLTAAMHVLGIETFTVWMNRVVSYLPTLVVGALIILAGVLVSNLARDLVIATAPISAVARRLLGRSVQGMILVTAIVIGADQIGINITFLVILTAVFAAAVLGGLALSMSLGSRTYVANLIGTRYLREVYRVGQQVRIGEHEGRILDFTPTAVVLETALGRMILPGKVFQEQPSVLLLDIDEHESH